MTNIDLFIKSNLKLVNNKIILSDDFLSFLKTRITELKRFEHSKSVASLCYEVALSNNLSEPMKYYLAGLLHDIGKNADRITKFEIMDKFYHSNIFLPKFSYHQFVGEYIAMHDLNIYDDDILQAIKYHCTGTKNMSPMAKIVYACDKIDPLRGYDSSEIIKAMKLNYEIGFKIVLKTNYNFLVEQANTKEEKDNVLNDLTKQCLECYLNK